MDIPLDEIIHFDCITTHPSTGAATDADSTPTFEVFEEATDTDIGVGGNLTKRTSKTGNYRGSFTASAANGFEVGKWYHVIASATVNAIAGKAVVKSFRIVLAESIAGAPKSDVHALVGVAQSATDLKDFADDGYDPATNKVQGVVLVDTVTTYTGNTPQTGDSFARLGPPAGASVSADVAAVKTDTGNLVTRITATLFSGITSLAQWLGLIAGKQTGNATARTELRATGAGSGTFDETTDSLESLVDNRTLAAASYATAATQTTIVTHLTDIKGATFNGGTDSLEAIRDRGDVAWITATGFSTLSQADVRTAVGLASANLDTQLLTIVTDTNELQTDWVNGGRLDLLIDSIIAKTNLIPAAPAAVGDIPTVAQIWTTALTEAYRATGATGTAAQLLYEILQNITEFTISGTTKTAKKLDGATTAKTYTLNHATTPTGITETT